MQLTANHRVLKIPCPRHAIFMAQQDGSFDLIFDLGSHGFVLDWFLRIGAELAKVLLPQHVNPPQQASAPSYVTPQAAVPAPQPAPSYVTPQAAVPAPQPAPQPQGSQPGKFAALQAAATILPVPPVSQVSSENQDKLRIAELEAKLAELELLKTPPAETPAETEQPKPESD